MLSVVKEAIYCKVLASRGQRPQILDVWGVCGNDAELFFEPKETVRHMNTPGLIEETFLEGGYKVGDRRDEGGLNHLI